MNKILSFEEHHKQLTLAIEQGHDDVLLQFLNNFSFDGLWTDPQSLRVLNSVIDYCIANKQHASLDRIVTFLLDDRHKGVDVNYLKSLEFLGRALVHHHNMDAIEYCHERHPNFMTNYHLGLFSEAARGGRADILKFWAQHHPCLVEDLISQTEYAYFNDSKSMFSLLLTLDSDPDVVEDPEWREHLKQIAMSSIRNQDEFFISAVMEYIDDDQYFLDNLEEILPFDNNPHIEAFHKMLSDRIQLRHTLHEHTEHLATKTSPKSKM